MVYKAIIIDLTHSCWGALGLLLISHFFHPMEALSPHFAHVTVGLIPTEAIVGTKALYIFTC